MEKKTELKLKLIHEIIRDSEDELKKISRGPVKEEKTCKNMKDARGSFRVVTKWYSRFTHSVSGESLHK
jgi:hypothetical protein